MFPPLLSIDGLLGRRAFLYFFCAAFTRTYFTSIKGWPLHHAAVAVLLSFAMVLGLEKAYERITWGKSRTLDWAKEVVVITGGSSGLGRVIADTYLMRGVKVAVLDVNTFEVEDDKDMASLRFYQCDIGDVEAVQRVKKMIEQHVGSLIHCLFTIGKSAC